MAGSRLQQLRDWSGIAALVTVLISLLTAATSIGRRDAEIDGKFEAVQQQKLDRGEYLEGQITVERRLGEILGEIRAMRSAVCALNPRGCQ